MNRMLLFCINLSSMVGIKGSAIKDASLYRARRGDYNEIISSAMEKTNELSVIKCSASCSMKQNCISVIFELDTKQCFLLSKRIPLDDLTKAFLPSNIKAFTKYTLGCSDFGYKKILTSSDRCFKANFDKKNKEDAGKECAKDDGFLAQIDSLAKLQEVIMFVLNTTGGTYYIDGSDEAIEDDWRLSDGRAVFLDWNPGEPNACCKSFESCLVIYRTGKVNDIPCIDNNNFLCERLENIN